MRHVLPNVDNGFNSTIGNNTHYGSIEECLLLGNCI